MCAIKRISFTGESLLKTGFYNNTSSTPTITNAQTANLEKQPKLKKPQKLKSAIYISSAIALASLGVAGIALRRGKTSFKQINKLENTLNILNENLKATNNKLDTQIKDLGKFHDGVIDGVKKDLHGEILSIAAAANNKTDNFITKIVDVNGKKMKLASVYNEVYGAKEEKLNASLRKEAAIRILGAIERKQPVPEKITIRVPTSEVKPFSSTGGMAIVPKELIANIAAMINTKQKANLFLDTPLYLGNAANNTTYSKIANLNEKGVFDGTYKYVKRTFDNGVYKDAGPATIIKEIEKMHIPIYTDKGVQNEEVTMYMSNVIKDRIDYNLLSKRLTPEVRAEVEKTLAENKTFESDLIEIHKITKEEYDLMLANARNNAKSHGKDPEKVVIKEEVGDIVAKAKYKAVFYDSPKFNMNGRIVEDRNINIYRNDAIATGETERFIYFSKFFTESLMNESAKTPLKADLIIGNDWQTGPISAILRQLTTVKKAYGMNPELADKLHNTPIVTLMHNAELAGSVDHSHEKLFNIMFGEHAARIVENAHMPNTHLEVYNAATDSKVLKAQGLPGNLWNALMDGQNIHPQLMAANYSDMLIPVSEQYGMEIASHGGFGKAAHDIFKIRARMFEFADESTIKEIAKQNMVNPELITKEPTLKGITNGCDAMNNTFSAAEAKQLEIDLNLPSGSFQKFTANVDVLEWHRKNKSAYLKKAIEDINLARNTKGEKNPMKIALPELTDLTGVNADTPIISSAGRIVDQKGLDIFAESIKEFYREFKGTNYPVFYVQGVGTDAPKIKKALMDIKRELAATNPTAANRIVFAELFSEAGRFNGCKLMSDFAAMPSWFEPCGLSHKEIAKYSGAIPIVFDVGGLKSGLKDNVNAIVLEFMPKYNGYEKALDFNAKSFAKGLNRACEWMADKESFAKGLKDSQAAEHSWLVPDGAMDKYAEVFVKMKVFKPEVLQSSTNIKDIKAVKFQKSA